MYYIHAVYIYLYKIDVVLCSDINACVYIYIYYIDTGVLLKNIPLVKFIKTTSGTRVVYFP